MRVEGGLSAHFLEPNGPRRPGVQWAIGLTQGDKTYSAQVKVLFADDARPDTRENQEYQAPAVMQYLSDCLSNGWHPDQPIEHTIDIGNPVAS